MPDDWFTVPLTTTPEPPEAPAEIQVDVTVPGYHDRVDGYSLFRLDGDCLVHFYADQPTLDGIAAEADTTRHADAGDAVSELASSDYPDPQEAAQISDSFSVG